MSIYELEKIKGSGSLLLDFRDMQSIAETENAQLKQQYGLLVTPNCDGSNLLPNDKSYDSTLNRQNSCWHYL